MAAAALSYQIETSHTETSYDIKGPSIKYPKYIDRQGRPWPHSCSAQLAHMPKIQHAGNGE
jgi:hypothetical protein